MEYRINRRTGDQISTIGLGTCYLCELEEEQALPIIKAAYEGGINFFDMATLRPNVFGYFGKALKAVREKIMYQIHFGANYETGEYGWTTDPEIIKTQVDQVLAALETDYIDYGFIHCLDEISDWEAYKSNGALDYLMKKKEEGVVRHIGLSTHNPVTAMKIMDEVNIDILMFSINPGYDYQQGEYGLGSVDERTALYKRCEAEGIGITVMKPFCGGQLLEEKLSPFGKALTDYQCIKYALDKPGTVTVLPGVGTMEQLEHMLSYNNADESEKDYSLIGTFKPADAAGKCVYCNHCQPCPVGIDVGAVNKYYDLARIGDQMAGQHYMNLELHAGDCTKCGHCNERCPFAADQMSRMKEIKEFFGK